MCPSWLRWSASIAPSIWSLGPTTRTRDIGSGLSIEGTLELGHHELHGPLDVRHARSAKRVRLPASLREDGLAIPRDLRLRRPDHRRGALVGLPTEPLPDLDALPPTVGDDAGPLARPRPFHFPALRPRRLLFFRRF